MPHHFHCPLLVQQALVWVPDPVAEPVVHEKHLLKDQHYGQVQVSIYSELPEAGLTAL